VSKSGISESDLHALVEGALEPERRAAVERYLAENPVDAGRVDIWKRQNQALNTLYAHIVDEPVPLRLDVHRLASESALTSRKRSWRGTAAAAMILLAIGVAGGWIGHGYWVGSAPGESVLVDEAVAAHSLYTREVVHPVEVPADQKAHLTAWLSKRLDRTLVVPDLSPLGFSLVGGRLLPAQGRPAAQLMYEDGTGQRVTFLLVAADTGEETALRYARIDGLNSFLWTDEAIRCVLVGSLARDQLRDIATRAYEQLG
jgi:anti-sigma factor RsiW